jgi:hypothetical protein
MLKAGATLVTLAFLAGCGGDQDSGGLTADEQQRLENIAARLDEENESVREQIEGDGNIAVETEINAVAPE